MNVMRVRRVVNPTWKLHEHRRLNWRGRWVWEVSLTVGHRRILTVVSANNYTARGVILGTVIDNLHELHIL